MKCKLVQILVVAMVLGQTVSIQIFNLEELVHELESTVKTGADAVADVTRGAASRSSG